MTHYRDSRRLEPGSAGLSLAILVVGLLAIVVGIMLAGCSSKPSAEEQQARDDEAVEAGSIPQIEKQPSDDPPEDSADKRVTDALTEDTKPPAIVCCCSSGCLSCLLAGGVCPCAIGGTPCNELCPCWLKPKTQDPKPKTHGIDSWFYCRSCKAWSHYTAPRSQLLTKCKHCDKEAYRTLNPPKRQAPAYCPTCPHGGASRAPSVPLNWFGQPKLRYR